MIDIEKARDILNEYIKKYDDTNPKIKLKKDHILRVADNAKLIAKKLNLSKEDIELAELIGLLHDIGRFEQIRIFNTYNDRQSTDHAEKGLQVLFEENLIREFLKVEDYDKIIHLAIKNHNKLRLESNLDQRELLHCKIIRDADKLDIFNIIVNGKVEDAVWFPIEDLSKEKITDKVFETILKDRMVDYKDLRTNADNIVAWYAYVYDIYFKESLEEITKRNYVDKISKLVEYKDEKTKEQMQIIKNEVNEYINKKLEIK